MDYLAELGLLSLGSRFKRISDALYQEMAHFYATQDIVFDPGNFPLLHFLSSRTSSTIGEATERLGISQAGVSQKAAALARCGYIRFAADKVDKRRRAMRLTAKGMALLARLQPTWAMVERAVAGQLGTEAGALLDALNHFERGLGNGDFRRRLAPPVTIIPFDRRYAGDFDRLNRAWIEQYFTVEPFDDLVLKQPEKMIIDTGGEIFFALENGKAVGCCALLPLEHGMLEFTKLGIDEAARGKGIARALLRHAASQAKKKGVHTVRIFTNSRLIPACTLYRSEGFVEVAMSAEQKARYTRGDTMFDLELS
jgi:ribosomal protein S18 acetylase RimI-like enzyme/DNA-binding MarR family transcriptional regulator